MRTTGRNDPCPCGSGKKYKNCCLRKDQETEDASYRASGPESFPPPPPMPAEPPVFSGKTWAQAARDLEEKDSDYPDDDEWEEDWDEDEDEDEEPERSPEAEALWAEFQDSPYAGQVILFTRALDNKDVLDADLAFDMLDHLFDANRKRGPEERQRFDSLVAALRARRPELYQEDAVRYLSWLIQNAIGTGRLDAVGPLADELADHAAEGPDLFDEILDQLAFHGQLALLTGMLRRAFPHFQQAEELADWALVEYAEWGADFETYTRLEEDPATNASDPVLLERLAPYLAHLGSPPLAEWLDRLAGRRVGEWQPADFEPPAGSQKKKRERGGIRKVPEDHRQRLLDLTVEFVGWLRRQEGVPFPKGWLARKGLFDYLLEMASGELRPFAAPGESGFRPATSLCPERTSLDDFLWSYFEDSEGGYHRAVGTFEMVPAWLRFLVSRRLIAPEERRRTLANLRPLGIQLSDLLEESLPTDPRLLEALESWGQERPPAGGSVT
jgi:hypothetical protein